MTDRILLQIGNKPLSGRYWISTNALSNGPELLQKLVAHESKQKKLVTRESKLKKAMEEMKPFCLTLKGCGSYEDMLEAEDKEAKL
jgi:hypothetical protein